MLIVESPLVHWSIGQLVHWSIGLLVHWSIGPLVHWSIGPKVHWSIGPLVDCHLSDVKCQKSNVKWQKSNVKCQRSIRLTFVGAYLWSSSGHFLHLSTDRSIFFQSVTRQWVPFIGDYQHTDKYWLWHGLQRLQTKGKHICRSRLIFSDGWKLRGTFKSTNSNV